VASHQLIVEAPEALLPLINPARYKAAYGGRGGAKSHFFADRNWLYTAVTRASKYCIVVGDRWGLGNAVKKNSVSQRRTFLDRWASSNLESGELVH